MCPPVAGTNADIELHCLNDAAAAAGLPAAE
jgi:hypothetical protein